MTFDAFVAILFGTSVTSVVGVCLQPLLPYTADGPCSGNGVCMMSLENGTVVNAENFTAPTAFCLCRDGFDGNGLLVDRNSQDCFNNHTAFLVVLCVCYAVHILALLLTLQRLYVFGKLRICDSKSGMYRRTANVQRVMLSHLLYQSAVITATSLSIFAGIHPSNDIGSAIAYLVAFVGLALDIFFRGTETLFLTLATTPYALDRRAQKRTKILAVANSLVSAAFHVIAFIGVGATTGATQLAFSYLWCVGAALQILYSSATLLPNFTAIINAVEALASKPDCSEDERERLLEAASKLRRQRLTIGIVNTVDSSALIVVAILQPLVSYFIPIAFSLYVIDVMNWEYQTEPVSTMSRPSMSSSRSLPSKPTHASPDVDTVDERKHASSDNASHLNVL